MRLISDDGEQMGIVSLAEALRISEEKELDLVEVAPRPNHQYVKSWIMGNISMKRQKQKRPKRNKI